MSDRVDGDASALETDRGPAGLPVPIRQTGLPLDSAQAGSVCLRDGVLLGLAAYGLWGLAPIYFKAVTSVAGALEVLAHRIVWSVLLLVILMTALRQWPVAWRAVRDRRTLLTLVATTALVAANWFGYIYAAATERIVEASLGYFINPLLNVLLGFVFLGERLRPAQRVSVGLATVGVGVMAVGRGVPPYISLFLAGTFAFYGLLRKRVAAGALVGLTIETMLLSPLALGYLVMLEQRQSGGFLHRGGGADVLLIASGLVTTVPLLCFAGAARRLRLSTLGFLQYLAPSLQLILGVLVYGEAFTWVHGLSFGFIWTGLTLYSADTIRRGSGTEGR